MGIITLTTDFGIRDPYVAMIKGVILGIDPSAAIVDLTHDVRPQDVVQAAFALHAAYRYFPPETVHVAVVDPGVGSKRWIVAMRVNQHLFLGPDNGILSMVAQESRADRAVRVENADLFLKPVSATFHGRDVFAPVAAHLSRGFPIHQLGPAVDAGSLVKLNLDGPKRSGENKLTGAIVAIDRFGNLITDIQRKHLRSLVGDQAVESIVTIIGNHRITGLWRTYCEVESQQPVVLVGSSGYLEISVNNGSAEKRFKAAQGDPIGIQRVNR